MFRKIFLLFPFLFLTFTHFCYSANILFFFTGGTYSHDISIWPLVIRLADQNHSVTFYSAHSKKPWYDPRIKVVNPPKIEEINSRYLGDTLDYRLKNTEYSLWQDIPTWSHEICEYILTDPGKPESRVLFHEDKYDLVILDSVLCDCGHIVGYYHKAKVIVSDSTSVLPWFHHIYGFSPEASWIPVISGLYHFPMSFFNMLENYLEPYYWTYIRRTQFYPKLEALMEKLLKGKEENIPSFLELERSAKLVFVNTHPSVELPRALPNNFIEIGGMQIWGQRNATIPEAVQKFIDDAEQGVIPLAFGSSVDFSSIPVFIEKAFFEAIENFPGIHFIAKASGEKPKHCPKNLMYVKWIPQKEVLAHPKTLACMTHGGLNGIIEATNLGVPLITIPIFAEQDYQSYKLQAREVGIRLEMRDLTADSLSSSISSITTNPKYRENMRVLQAAFRDRPQSPIDLAMHWIEYVLRHDDMAFMNPMTYQTWTVCLEKYIFTTYSLITAGFVTLLVTVFTLGWIFKRK